MADTVTISTVQLTQKEVYIHLTGQSDGSGETAVNKVIRTDYLIPPLGPGTAGNALINPVSLDIEYVRWNMQGYTAIQLLWNHTTPVTAMFLNANGIEDYTQRDNMLRDTRRTGGLLDPRTAGGSGNIQLTTIGATSGGTYDITIGVKFGF